MKVFVEQTGNQLPPSPQNNRRDDHSPDTAYTENLESLNVVQADNQYVKGLDGVFVENSQPLSVRSADGRHSTHLDHLFTGSELSEGFMRSGRSTPTIEYRDKPAVKFASVPAQNPHSKKILPPVADVGTGLPALAVGSDFRMSLIPQQRVGKIAEMNDGFSAAVVSHKNTRHPPSPVKRSYHQHNSDLQQTKEAKREPRMSAPLATRQGRGRAQKRATYVPVPAKAFRDNEDSSSSVQDEEDGRATLRSKPITVRNKTQRDYSPTTMPVGRKRPHISLDYDDQMLNEMEYKDLLQQPFDFNPATATSSTSADGHQGGLNQRLAQMKHMGRAEQERLFGSMSVEEWELAGAWFSDQFASITQKLTTARQSKRRIVDSFEQEAATREADVRRCSNKIDENLQKMREDGMKVVSGRGS
ncbi:hypothetical protein NQ176_g6897 [Zarea fungicola]|uniref:Uncharacterized protein n=1 Tax=Zarea fungicola TaxID=93591 RepID=A0ACC1N1D3_9HYPO|nr:hypothetical protein NQ176_g6897 [Lecanicillium fungicola]